MSSKLRAPFAYFSLMEAGASANELRNEVGFEPGFVVNEQSLRQAAAKYRIPYNLLYTKPDTIANQRFKEKLRGSLASYLFDDDGVFRLAGTSDYLYVLGLVENGSFALPDRAPDALLLESRIRQVIERGDAMLKALDAKFIASETEKVFGDQAITGEFRARRRYRNTQAGVTFHIDGREFKSIKEVAELYELNYEKLRFNVKKSGLLLENISGFQWAEFIKESKR